MAGLPIDQHCEAQQVSVRGCVKLLVEIAGALAAVHRALVVHGDIRCESILITADGTPKLIDVARAAAVIREPVTAAADIYALGVVAYELTRRYGSAELLQADPQRHLDGEAK